MSSNKHNLCQQSTRGMTKLKCHKNKRKRKSRWGWKVFFFLADSPPAIALQGLLRGDWWLSGTAQSWEGGVVMLTTHSQWISGMWPPENCLDFYTTGLQEHTRKPHHDSPKLQESAVQDAISACSALFVTLFSNQRVCVSYKRDWRDCSQAPDTS